MDAEKLKSKKYLRTVDIPMDGLLVTIAGTDQVTLKGRDGSEQDKGTLLLENQKPLVLNTTNIDKLIELLGRETDNWAGQKVLLITPLGEAFGKTQPVLRITTPPTIAPVAKPKKKLKPETLTA